MQNFRHTTSWGLWKSTGLGKHKETKITLLNVLRDEMLLAALPAMIVGVGVPRTGCASSFPPLQRVRELKTRAGWTSGGCVTDPWSHQPAPRRRASPKLHAALFRCHSGAQRKATLPSASHQLIYKNYRCSYRRVCSELPGLGAALLCLSWKKNLVGKGKTGQHLSLFQAKVVPRQVLLGSPRLMEKNPLWFWQQEHLRIIVHKE